ncbi:MAG: hypothetical protein HY323_04010, partial [Betaproteobacteria bacterium]|nr:hypothetical protein [Betaproteobacteria bacterium]
MSLINQMLLDLEKRRASTAERSALPDHVRALPETHGRPRLWWVVITVSILAAAVAAAMVFGMKQSSEAQGLPGKAQHPRVDAVAPSVVAAARPAATPDVAPRDEAPPAMPPAASQPAGRLSFELSNLPPAPAQDEERATPPSASRAAEPAASKAPIATARVVGKTQAEAARAEPGPATAQPRSEARPAQRNESAKSRSMKGEVVASAKPGAAARRPPAAEALAAPRPQIDKHVKQPTAHQLAEEEYRKATAALHQGR